MERGRFYQQCGERSGKGEAGSARQFVTDLIQRQGLKVGTISEYCTDWTFMPIHVRKTLPEAIADKVCTTITDISRGLDFLAYSKRYDQISEAHKAFVLEGIPDFLKSEGTDRVTFSYDDAKLLQMAAAVVNIPYDPGEPEDTPENNKKRTFVFTDLKGIPPLTANVVDADK